MEWIEGQVLQSPLMLSGFGLCFSRIWFEDDGNEFDSMPVRKT